MARRIRVKFETEGKKFEDLKQLDRIEYFLLNKERQNYSLFTLSMVYLMVQIIILIMLFGILFIGFFNSTLFFEKTAILLPILSVLYLIFFKLLTQNEMGNIRNKQKLDRRFGLK
jgi:NADH:ubiquinone oxidoreductase subunit H